MSEEDPTDRDDDTRSEKLRQYRAAYWERFSQTRKRVYGTLTVEEYERIEARAKEAGRAVWSQIHAEAEAYARGEYLPTKTIEEQIGDLIAQLRYIGNNINQITRDMHTEGTLDSSELARSFAALEERIRAFTSRPWGTPGDDDNEPDS